MIDREQTIVRASSIVFRTLSNGSAIALNPVVPHWIRVNEAGKKVLEYLAKPLQVSELIQILLKMYDVMPDERASFESKILNFVQNLRDNFMIQDTESYVQTDVPRRAPSLSTLSFRVTERCNLRCIHCNVYIETPQTELSLSDMARLFSEFKRLGGESLVITGGEPFLRSDLMDIIQAARSVGIARVTVSTNGTLIRNSLVKKLSKWGIGMSLSVDGATPETHDFIRGSGQFGRVTRAIRALTQAGVNVTLAWTLMKPNIGQVEQMFQLAQELGCVGLYAGLLVPDPRNVRRWAEMEPGEDELVKAVGLLRTLSREYKIRFDLRNIMDAKIRCAGRHDLCDAGISMVSVSSIGDVYPCDFLHHPQTRMGNVRTDSLSSILEKSEVRRYLGEISVDKLPVCSSCPLLFICGGGCLADRLFYCGSLEGPNMYCSFYAKLLWKTISEEGS